MHSASNCELHSFYTKLIPTSYCNTKTATSFTAYTRVFLTVLTILLAGPVGFGVCVVKRDVVLVFQTAENTHKSLFSGCTLDEARPSRLSKNCQAEILLVHAMQLCEMPW